jgi:mRNA interferase MazF
MLKHFEAGDLVWLDFSDSAGHEQAGRRPAVVVSTDDYNARSSLIVACPVTSSNKPWPFKVKLHGELNGIAGFALADQLRGVDPKARYPRKAGKVSGQCLEEIRALIAVILSYPLNPRATR